MPPPPGIFFIVRVLARLLPTLTCFYAARYALATYLDISISSMLFWLAFGCAVPSYIVSKIVWTLYADRRAAAAMGAVPIPTWEGKWIGSIDLLRYIMKTYETGYPAEGFQKPHKLLGPTFNFRVLWSDQVFTTEPDHVKTILATDFANFEKGSTFQYAMAAVLGTGVFNSDGDMWKFHRSMTRPFFSRDRITHFDLFERHADAAIAQMKHRLSEGYAIDFQDVASRFTLDSASEFLFGSCVHSLASGLPYPHTADPRMTMLRPPSRADAFAQAFIDAQSVISARTRLGPQWPIYEIFADRAKAPMAIVNAYLDPILADAVKKRANDKTGVPRVNKGEADIDDGETLLDHLVKYTDDPVILKDETLNILIAGRDTTASTLTFVTYILAMYPHVLARLRAEILEKVGPARRPTYDDIREMKYLRAVINETLRLFPPVPFNIRDTIRATTLSPTAPGNKPFYVPAKTGVIYSVFMMHRRTDLWGPDALEFDPDRFLDARLHKYLTPNPFIFLPFNAGPRICLGQQFAYNETSFMLIRLLQNFDSVQLDAAAQPPDSRPPAYWADEGGRQAIEQFFPRMHLTMYAHKGLWVKMREADNSESTSA